MTPAQRVFVGPAIEFANTAGNTAAGKAGRVHRVDESEIMYFGPRTPGAVRALRRMIRGG